MKKYLIIGHRDEPQLPEDLAPEQFQAWGAFFEALGTRVVDGGNPLDPKKRAILKDGKVVTLADKPVGYYMISAESLEEACELIKSSPLSNAPGCEVRIYETIPM